MPDSGASTHRDVFVNCPFDSEYKQQFNALIFTRIELDPSTQLPRFNMALESGIFLGANLLSEIKKPCLVMDTERYRYQRFCSDLSGFDPSAHGGDIHLREFCEEQHLNPDSISYYDYISSLQGWLEGKGLREKETS
jgi:hypothetical protein